MLSCSCSGWRSHLLGTEGAIRSRYRHIRFILELYLHWVALMAVLSVALPFEEVVGKPGDLIKYECPTCGRKADLHFQDPWPHCDKHPEREMTPLEVVKSAEEEP